MTLQINNDSRVVATNIKRLGFEEAGELLALAQAHTQLPCKVIDDGCHERAEVVLKLAISAGIDPLLLRRAFVFNTDVGGFLSMQKPLIEPIKEWFKIEREAGRLHTGARYVSNLSVFVVDEYGALRAEAMPTIYLDDTKDATWGVGHVAVMVGNYVVDTAFHHPITFAEWQSAMNLQGMIPLVGNIRSLPELHIEELDELGINKISRALGSVFEDRTSETQEQKLTKVDLANLYQLLDDHQKTAFFDSLFEEQIKAKGLYSREHWTEVYPGPLTSRGENYDEFCPSKRADIKLFLAKSSPKKRLETSLEILRPFKDYERMILGYRYEWFSSEAKA